MSEHMPLVRWIGFVLIWLALVVLTIDIVLQTQKRRKTHAAVSDK